MKKLFISLALLILATAIPAMAQDTNEWTQITGGKYRMVPENVAIGSAEHIEFATDWPIGKNRFLKYGFLKQDRDRAGNVIGISGFDTSQEADVTNRGLALYKRMIDHKDNRGLQVVSLMILSYRRARIYKYADDPWQPVIDLLKKTADSVMKIE